MYDWILGNDPLPGYYDGKMGLFIDYEGNGCSQFYTKAETMIEEIRSHIFLSNNMDDPYGPMKPFAETEIVYPGMLYCLYNLYYADNVLIVERVAVPQIVRVAEPKVDEHFRSGNLIGIGNGWCVLLDKEAEDV
jgi:hypothetical protein